MPFGIGWAELLIIFVIVLLLFGAKRLPEIAQGLGKGIREFKKTMRDTTDEVKGSLDVEDRRDYNKSMNSGAGREDRDRGERPSGPKDENR